MEIWHLDHDQILDIPWSRRYRLFQKKEVLEKKREAARRQAASRKR